jgi:hypothetical protein
MQIGQLDFEGPPSIPNCQSPSQPSIMVSHEDSISWGCKTFGAQWQVHGILMHELHWLFFKNSQKHAKSLRVKLFLFIEQIEWIFIVPLIGSQINKRKSFINILYFQMQKSSFVVDIVNHNKMIIDAPQAPQWIQLRAQRWRQRKENELGCAP